MKQRRRARELMVQALYAAQVGGVPLEEAVRHQLERRRPGPEIRQYVARLTELASKHLAELDRGIDAVLTGWSPERVAAVERAILRLALLEMRHLPDIPPKVALCEAVELARSFSGEEAAGFVNGVLDRLLEGGEEDPPRGSTEGSTRPA